MTIESHETNVQLEKEGRAALTLIGLRYVGQKSIMTPDVIQRQGAWPGAAPLQGGPLDEDGTRQPGPMQLALVPDWTDDTVEDRTVVALENNNDVEVVYEPAELARCLLERNFLPPDVFSSAYNKTKRERLFTKLGLEDEGVDNDAAYREQLREVAGVEGVDEAPETVDVEYENRYKSEYTRGDLMSAARALGWEWDNSASKVDVASWLARQETKVAEKALEFAENDVDDVRQKLVDDGHLSDEDPEEPDESEADTDGTDDEEPTEPDESEADTDGTDDGAVEEAEE